VTHAAEVPLFLGVEGGLAAVDAGLADVLTEDAAEFPVIELELHPASTAVANTADAMNSHLGRRVTTALLPIPILPPS
jgi:hypothetical protein